MQISARKLRELIRRKKGHYNFEEEKPVHGYEYEVGSEKKIQFYTGKCSWVERLLFETFKSVGSQHLKKQ